MLIRENNKMFENYVKSIVKEGLNEPSAIANLVDMIIDRIKEHRDYTDILEMHGGTIGQNKQEFFGKLRERFPGTDAECTDAMEFINTIVNNATGKRMDILKQNAEDPSHIDWKG